MKENCNVEIWDRFTHAPCRKKVFTHFEGKPYCKIHSPQYIAEREALKNAEEKKLECVSKDCTFNFKRREYYSYCPYCGLKR